MAIGPMKQVSLNTFKPNDVNVPGTWQMELQDLHRHGEVCQVGS